MFAKICDNCNELAAVEDQDCISVKFRYNTQELDFCSQKCLNEYFKKEEECAKKIEELKDKIIEIIGEENIEKLAMIIKDNTRDDVPSFSYRNEIIYKKIFHDALDAAIERKL